jgi:cobyrinic acid a,c-diamide synthase
MVARLVVGGLASSVGKTTTVVALARAFAARGLRVALFKCGPDYLDPTYHERATGRPAHNLDGWMMGKDAVRSTFARGSRDADIALVEGVMGLFDGASPTSDQGSTAEIAKWLDAPVIAVVDASGMARTLAAIAGGLRAFDPELSVVGLIANRVGSKGHLDLLRSASPEPPILGGLPRENDLTFPERHLGLHTADERAVPESVLARWGEIASEWFALDRILAIARACGPLSAPAEAPAQARERDPAAVDGGEMRRGVRIGLAWDEAFHFYYDDNLRRLEDLGATLRRFSPLHDSVLPAVEGVYIGGGYPELYAARLAANATMRSSLHDFAAQGGPVYAECGGLMYLSSQLETLDGQVHPMVGLIDADVVMRPKLVALGYVEVETQRPTLLGPAGLRFRGHQFRYSELKREGAPASAAPYAVRRRRGPHAEPEGHQVRNVLASYVHAHWASNPLVARGLVESCARSGDR